MRMKRGWDFRVEAAFLGRQAGRGRVWEAVTAATPAGAVAHALATLTHSERRHLGAIAVNQLNDDLERTVE